MMYRSALVLMFTIMVPACSGDTAIPAMRLPSTLADASYSNGHPLVKNTAQNQQLELDHVASVNAWRAANGLSEFSSLESINAIARAYSHHMAIEPFFSHIAPEGGELRDRIYTASGIEMVFSAENLMKTADGSAANVLASFLASPTHKDNLATTVANAIGVGIWFDGSLYYVTYEFVWQPF